MAMKKKKSCMIHKKSVNFVFPCSGVADTGEIADRAARWLLSDGVARMICLAGVSAGINGFLNQMKNAQEILIIDGCKIECTKKILQGHGIGPSNTSH